MDFSQYVIPVPGRTHVGSGGVGIQSEDICFCL
ncbi:TPA: hypothetical protein ACKRLB_003380 [Proteus mirabilis]|nr:hypothetical protein [Proteus mirabilis]